MGNKTVIILRGLPGSGKSTLANILSNDNPDIVCTADDYFMIDGEYKFDMNKLGNAHKACQNKFMSLLNNQSPLIIVANTNIKESDFLYYESNAKYNGYLVFHIVVENRHGNSNIHNVPENTLERMKNNFNIKI